MDNNTLKYLFLIIIVFIAACIETDIYLPTFPDMMAYFSVDEESIQSILTWNFFGICLSGPLYGPISDAIGRKKPLLLALGFFLIGSLITIVTYDFIWMLGGRLLQGIGSGGCFTLGTAIIFDVFQATKAIQALNQINSIIPFLMALAPMLGGFLNHVYGFRSNFLAIAFLVLVSFLITLFFFHETLPKEKRTPLQAKQLLQDFKCALTCLPFWQLTIVVSLLFAGYMAFLSATAVIFVIEFGMSKQVFPFYQGAILVAWLVANLSCNKAIIRCGLVKVKMIGTALLVIGGFGLGICSWITPENPNLLTSMMLLYAFGANWTMGLYFPEAMEILPDIKGITASILTSLRLLITAIIVGLTSVLYDTTMYPLVTIVMGIITIIVPTIILYEKNKKTATAVSQLEQSHLW